MPPPDHRDDEAKDDPWADEPDQPSLDAPTEPPASPGAAGLDVEGPAGESDEPLELWDDGAEDAREGIADEELDAEELALVDEIPEERGAGAESPSGLGETRDDDDDGSFEDRPADAGAAEALDAIDEALGIDLVDERGSRPDGGEEGTGEEPEVDEGALPPLDADDEGGEAQLVDPSLELGMLGSAADDRWELTELAPGRFRAVAIDGELVVAGGDTFLLRHATGPWRRHELGEQVLACAASDGRVAIATPTRVLVGSAAAFSASGHAEEIVERRVERVEQLGFARGRICFVDRHGQLFDLGESGQVELLEREVLALASTAAGIVMVRRAADGAVLLERRRGDDRARIASALRMPSSMLEERALRAFASPRGDVALVSGGRVAFSLGGGDRFASSAIECAVSAVFVMQADAVSLAVASREPAGLVLRLPAERASAETAATLPMELGEEEPVGLVWDAARDAFLLATPQGLYELRRSAAH